MIANKYLVKMNEDGSGTLCIFQGNNKTELCKIPDLINLSAIEVEKRIAYELEKRDIQIKEIKNDLVYAENQKVDLNLVRTKMRDILKELSNKEIPLAQRKQLLDVYQQMCSSAQIIVNTCKLELQIDQLERNKK